MATYSIQGDPRLASQPKLYVWIKDGTSLTRNDLLHFDVSCKVCYEEYINTVLFPCGHALLCHRCAENRLPASDYQENLPNVYGPYPLCNQMMVFEKVRQEEREFIASREELRCLSILIRPGQFTFIGHRVLSSGKRLLSCYSHPSSNFPTKGSFSLFLPNTL